MKEKDIYQKLRDARRSRGITVTQLAEEIGEDHQKVGRIERGKRSLTIDYLLKISKALETPIDTLLGDFEGNPTDKQEMASPDLLGQIVVSVEEKVASLGCSLSPKQKGRIVSLTHEGALKFPQNQQMSFIETFLNGVFVTLADF